MTETERVQSQAEGVEEALCAVCGNAAHKTHPFLQGRYCSSACAKRAGCKPLADAPDGRRNSADVAKGVIGEGVLPGLTEPGWMLWGADNYAPLESANSKEQVDKILVKDLDSGDMVLLVLHPLFCVDVFNALACANGRSP